MITTLYALNGKKKLPIIFSKMDEQGKENVRQGDNVKETTNTNLLFTVLHRKHIIANQKDFVVG